MYLVQRFLRNSLQEHSTRPNGLINGEISLIDISAAFPGERDVVLFDADNTLWVLEPLYDEARRELCRIVVQHDGRGTEHEVEQFQRETDRQLHKSMGYSRERFAKSFLMTAEKFLSEDTLEALRPRVVEVALKAIDTPAPNVEGVEKCLEQVSRLFWTAIYTAGDKAIQTRRVQESGLERLVHHVEYVDTKSVEQLEALIQRLSVTAAQVWVVGDSPRSDIQPALRAGCRAIWIRNKNWHEVEAEELPESPMLYRVDNLESASDVLMQVRGAGGK